MDLDELRRNWERFGREDPMWAILSEPDKRGRGWDEEEFFANGRALVSAIMSQLEPFGVPRHRDLALDFGCGLGRLTQACCEHFDRAIGVDIAVSMIEGARDRNRYGERCRYVHNPHPDLRAIDSGSVDFVLSLLVLQHMTTELAQGYITEFLRVLRPGGAAVFQVPYRERPGRQPAPVATGTGPVMEMHATPKDEVFALLDEGGARLLACREDDGGGDDWSSCVYVATRDRATGND